MKKSLCVVAAIFAMHLSATSDASAGDCKNVKFIFKNSTGKKIKLKSIRIDGNKGKWVENLADKEVADGGSYTTTPQDLNKLDNGATGKFEPIYFVWRNNEWRGDFDVPPAVQRKCTSEQTMTFDLTKSN
jgi:hypothetical protein